VARQLDEQLTTHFPPAGGAHAAFRRLRVLDVGPGQGTQAIRLARAGHLVTGLEADPVMAGALRDALAAEPRAVRDRLVVLLGDGRETGRHFGPACFDVVLCHGVLMYLPDPEPMLAGLARVLAPGGLLSLLVRNGDALAMRPGLLGDFASALHAFGSAGYAGYEGAAEPAGAAGSAGAAGYVNRLGLHARADRLEPMRATLTGINVPLHTWYGVRVFTDAAPDHAMPPSEPGALAALLAAEAAAGRTDPYRAVAALLHICGIRVAR
jgi:SAM-dependent methyltransferase